MDSGKGEREIWHNTCMIPLDSNQKAFAHRIRTDAIRTKTGYSELALIYGLCSYCKSNDATHTIHRGNLLSSKIDYTWFCSPECLQGAILEAIFKHNLTSKRFLSLITKD